MGESEKRVTVGNGSVEEVCLQIIALAGDAKSRVYEALDASQNCRSQEASGLLAEAKKHIAAARRIQHSLLTAEARGAGIEPSILLSHAMDILITAESECNLAGHILQLFCDGSADPQQISNTSASSPSTPTED
jgi:cellobiose-specific phosphotransferase system component IIA